jgi:hypothetical protein
MHYGRKEKSSMIDRSTSEQSKGSDSRRAFLERAGKAGAAAAATTVVLATMKPERAAAHYSGPQKVGSSGRHHRHH